MCKTMLLMFCSRRVHKYNDHQISMNFCNNCGILLDSEMNECKACYHSRVLGVGGPDIDCVCDYCSGQSGTGQSGHVSDKWKDSHVDNVIRTKWQM